MLNNFSYSRWLAVGILAFVLTLVFILAIVPLISAGIANFSEMKELNFRLQRYHQIASRKASINRSIDQLKRQYASQNLFSNHDTVALASADLQKFIKNAISNAGGQLTSTQVLPSRSENGLSQITVKVRMSGDMETLRSVLHEIESARPIMIVNQIDIRPMRGRRNRMSRIIKPSNQMNVNFDVLGFLRGSIL